MRVVVAVLVLLNLAFFAWARWLDMPATRSAAQSASTRPDARVARLILASEARGPEVTGAPGTPTDSASAAATASVAGTAGTAAASPAQSACASYGPIEDTARAGRVMAALRARGLVPRQRAEAGEVPDGWRVLVGELATPADEERAMRELATGAIPDAASIPDATDGRRISVGVFRARDRADLRAREVRRLGLTPVIVDRMRPGTAYWVDVALAPGAQAPAAESLLAEDPPGHALRAMPCPAGAGSATLR